MELFFETRKNIVCQKGKIRFIQNRPAIHPKPVIIPDTFVDSGGAYVLGTVVKDEGIFRMWYYAKPNNCPANNTDNTATVAYAESDDGLNWRKPKLGIVKCGPKSNNLTNLGLHSPSIWINPDAPALRRYCATGYGDKKSYMANKDIGATGYYTAFSADGLRWSLDPEPRWPGADVITSIYHPGRNCGVVAMKYMPWIGGLRRRTIYTSELHGNESTEPVIALLPDEYADIAAIQHGGVSADYYGMGMQAAGKEGLVGFLWNFWHKLPYKEGPCGMWGNVDISLVYQDGPRDSWQHVRGRPDFIARRDVPSNPGCIYSSSCPVEVGDKHYLYFTSVFHSHGWNFDENAQRSTDIEVEHKDDPKPRIYVAHWPKWRLFGFQAVLDGILTIEVKLERPHCLKLNYASNPQGYIRVGILDSITQKYVPQQNFEDSNALTGENNAAVVSWKYGDVIVPVPGHPLHLQFQIHDATVYAYELEPV